MNWIVDITDQDRGSQSLSPTTMEAARAALRESGCVLLRGVYSTASIDALRAAFEGQWGERSESAMDADAKRPGANPVLRVGEKRYELLVSLTGALAHPMLLANPTVCSLLAAELGSNMRISGITGVVSYPGAQLQHIHSDHPLLFEQHDLSTAIPAYAINVAVPLIDVDQEIGPTAVCLGSHRWPQGRRATEADLVSVGIQRGDCLLIDYRTQHSGMPNKSAVARPILYLVYARNWFFDDVNHVSRPSLNMPLESFAALPEPVKYLMSRAYSAQMRARYFRPDR